MFTSDVKVIKKQINSIRASMARLTESVRIAAINCTLHAIEHGNTTPANDLLDATRRTKLLVADLLVHTGIFVKGEREVEVEGKKRKRIVTWYVLNRSGLDAFKAMSELERENAVNLWAQFNILDKPKKNKAPAKPERDEAKVNEAADDTDSNSDSVGAPTKASAKPATFSVAMALFLDEWSERRQHPVSGDDFAGLDEVEAAFRAINFRDRLAAAA